MEEVIWGYTILLLIYVGGSILVKTLLEKILKIRATKRKVGLRNESSIYKSLQDIYEKDKPHVYSREKLQALNAVLEVDKEELYHAKRLLESDGVIAGLFMGFNSLMVSLVMVFLGLYSNYFVEPFKDIFNFVVTAEMLKDLFSFGFLCILLYGVYGILNNIKKDKYFLSLIQDKIKEKETEEINQIKMLENELAELKLRITALSKRKTLTRKKNQSKRNRIHVHVGLVNRR